MPRHFGFRHSDLVRHSSFVIHETRSFVAIANLFASAFRAVTQASSLIRHASFQLVLHDRSAPVANSEPLITRMTRMILRSHNTARHRHLRAKRFGVRRHDAAFVSSAPLADSCCLPVHTLHFPPPSRNSGFQPDQSRKLPSLQSILITSHSFSSQLPRPFLPPRPPQPAVPHSRELSPRYALDRCFAQRAASR